MNEAHRPSEYLEYRDAAATILSRESGDTAVKAFGLNELLDGVGPDHDLTPVYAFLEAQGRQVSVTPVLARLGLVGHSWELGTVASDALLGWPFGAQPWVAVPGLTAGVPVAMDVPGRGLVVAVAGRVRSRVTPGPIADDYLAIVGFDPDEATVAVGDATMATRRPAMLARVQLGAAAEILGLVTRILTDANVYTRVRRQFGQPLSSFQVVQHLLAWAATERHQLESMYDLTLEQTVRHGADAVLSAAVKAQAGRVLHAVAQTAIQVTGGISFTWEYPLNRPHQRGLGLDQFAGSSSDLTLALGRHLRIGSEFPRLFGL